MRTKRKDKRLKRRNRKQKRESPRRNITRLLVKAGSVCHSPVSGRTGQGNI